MPDHAPRVLTCRDLYRLLGADFADHDHQHQVAGEHGACYCTRRCSPGTDGLACEDRQLLLGGDIVLDLCCRCWDEWPGTADELGAEVREVLASPGFCVVEVIRRATGEVSYAPCEEDRRERLALAKTEHGSVRIVLPGLSRETAVRVAARMTKVRSREERRARCG